MRAAVVSPYRKERVVRMLRDRGFKISNDPQVVFSYGGDGTILEAERRFPGVPIAPIQKSRICSNCSIYSVADLDRAVQKIVAGKFRVKEEMKIEASFKGKRIAALNEIQMHIADPRRALRFSVRNGVNYGEIIGDGIVAATPFGSTAYYRSIGYTPFSSGLRIGFNNAWPRLPAIETKKAVVVLRRGSALLLADNFFKRDMKEGDRFIVRESKQKARFVVV